MNAPPCRFDTPAPSTSRVPRADSRRADGCTSAAWVVAASVGAPTISSGALSATNVPRPVAEFT